MNNDLILGVSDFVAVFNQTVEYAYPSVTIVGELSNFKISKNRWVYFDLVDEQASVRFFGTVYGLPGPLEDGMLLQVRGQPRLHPQFGFSISFQLIQPVGEGSIRRASDLLAAKLTAEGLFDESRKRPLTYPPATIGLITSNESAAYHDFTKILGERWTNIEILLANVQVQGEAAASQIEAALDHFNTQTAVDCIVITRGGGSADDLAVFSTESVTRAVAASRIPTLVAIGHEVDVSLAELAADLRASTPSNAAELLVPDKQAVLRQLALSRQQLDNLLVQTLFRAKQNLTSSQENLQQHLQQIIADQKSKIAQYKQIVELLNPNMVLQRGYALVYKDARVVRSAEGLQVGDSLNITLADAVINTEVKKVTVK